MRREWNFRAPFGLRSVFEESSSQAVSGYPLEARRRLALKVVFHPSDLRFSNFSFVELNYFKLDSASSSFIRVSGVGERGEWRGFPPRSFLRSQCLNCDATMCYRNSLSI
jgi:hypothetical protein